MLHLHGLMHRYVKLFTCIAHQDRHFYQEVHLTVLTHCCITVRHVRLNGCIRKLTQYPNSQYCKKPKKAFGEVMIRLIIAKV